MIGLKGERPSVAALHPDWRRGWGPSIGDDALRAALEGNPRLQRRIVEAIGETHDMAVSGAPRMDSLGAAAAKAIAEDRTGFTRLCGLAQIGRRLAMATNPDDYGALARAFGAEAMAVAVRIATKLPEGGDVHGYDSEQLVPAVDRLGGGVLREWIATQPRAAQTWLTMMLPRQRGEDTTNLDAERATAIVEAALDAWPLPAREGVASAKPRRLTRRAA